MLCKKRGYVSADGKPALDWEEKEILLVKCSCQKKKCSERSNCKCRKVAMVFAVVLFAHV